MSRGASRVYLDIILPTVGRIKRVTDRRLRNDIVAMLRALAVQAQHEPKRWALLWDIKDGRRSLEDVFALYQAGRLNELPGLQLTADLEDAVDAWVATFEVAEKHKLSVQDSFRALRGQLQRRATVSDVPQLVALYRAACAETPRQFNLARAAALAFFRDTLSEQHSLYADVRIVKRLRERRQGKPAIAL